MALGVELGQAAEESKIRCISACESNMKPGGRQFCRMSIEAGQCYFQASRVKRAVLRTMGDLGCPLLVHDFTEMVIGRSSKNLHHAAQGTKVKARTGFECIRKTPITGLQRNTQFVGSLFRGVCEITIDYPAEGLKQVGKWRLKGGEAMRKFPTMYRHRDPQPEKMYSSDDVSSGGIVE
jgi:hypothetical protein